MQNLIQIQDDLQNVDLQTLMQYAQGANPMVPSYMATGEMQRRKSLEDLNSQFQAAGKQPPGTVLSQLENKLANPTQMQNPAGINPAAAQPGANPAAAQPGVSPSAPPPGMNPAAPAPGMPQGGVAGLLDPATQDPEAQQQPVSAAGGGLMTIPTNHFRASSFAGGGIVAFADNPDQPVSPMMAATPEDGAPSGADPQEAPQPVIVSNNTASAQTPATAPKPATAAAPRAPAQAPFAMQMEKPKEKSLDELIAENKMLNQKMGVSADPFAEVKAMQAAREKRQEAQHANDPMDRLITQLTAFGSAAPEKGFGYAMGAGAKASKELESKQNELKDKSEESAIAFRHSIAKEEDALRRGDAKGVMEAKKEQEKHQLEFAKYTNEFQNSISSRIQAGASASRAATDAGQLALAKGQQEGIISLRRTQAEENTARAERERLQGESTFYDTVINKPERLRTAAEKSAMDALSKDIVYKNFKENLKDIPIGTPEYNAVTDYIKDVEAETIAAKLENRAPRKITPPANVDEVKSPWYDIGGKTIPPTIRYDKPSFTPGRMKEDTGLVAKPVPLDAKGNPDASQLEFGEYYQTANGKMYWNGKKMQKISR